MPLHDYQCEACGAKIIDRLEPRLDTAPPDCPASGVLEGHVMVRLWTRRHGTRGFMKFTHETADGRTIELDSLSAVRKHEKQTVDLAAAGLGQPEIFRQFSQDQSNRDANVFGRPDVRKPKKTTRRGIPLVTVKEEFTASDSEE
jgi:hypothetical protein